jgi:hypothetical protein
MANFQSKQIIDQMPIPSHGYASSVKCAHFQVVIGAAGANLDTIEFGYLPDYAVPVDVVCKSTAAVAGINVGYATALTGLVAGLALVANVPTRSTAAAALIFQNVGLGQRKVVGAFTGVAAVGTLDVAVFYLVEDQGTGYPFVASA